MVEKKGNARMSAGIDSLDANETYTGGENPITLKAMFQGVFVCSFDDIASYPFDTEYCFVELYISGSENNFTVLIPKTSHILAQHT